MKMVANTPLLTTAFLSVSALSIANLLYFRSQTPPCQTNVLRTSTQADVFPTNTPSAFDKVVDQAIFQLKREEAPSGNHAERLNAFNLEDHKKGTGGLTDSNRRDLAKIYANANSVFEYGLGESTLIAASVNVPRYTGIDSDPVWVAQARDSVADHPHFRFYLADIGSTKMWGKPEHSKLPKNVWNYQIVPLQTEREAFDVYMVDGRWRFPCLLVSFLHASAYGGKGTIVLVHDCQRTYYHMADHLLELEMTGATVKLCKYKRKPDTTDDQLLELWMEHYQETA